MSKLLAMPLFLVTLVSTAAYAPGRTTSGSPGGTTRAHKAAVTPRNAFAGAHSGGDTAFDTSSAWDGDLEGDRRAWNQWDFGTLDFDNTEPGWKGMGADELHRDSLLASTSAPGDGQIELSQEALRGFDRLMRFAGTIGGGSSRSSGKSSGSPPVSGTPGASSGPPGDMSGAPGESRGPASTSPSDGTPADGAPPGEAPADDGNDQAPQGNQPPPVSVPEPASIWLLSLGLIGALLARRRSV